MNINQLTRLIIAKAIKNHWLSMTPLILLQYFTGQFMTGTWKLPPSAPISFVTLSSFHRASGVLLALGASFLFISKLYLLMIVSKAKKQAQALRNTK